MKLVRNGFRGALVVGAAMLLVGTVGAGAASSDTLTNPKHFYWAAGQPGISIDPVSAASNDLIYHGGNAGAGAIGVEQKPAVYLVYWGPQWAQGFQIQASNGKLYSSKSLQSYVNSFFQNVGGSHWANITTQYCNGVAAGATSCAGGSGFVTTPKGQLKGVWTDPTPVPDDIITLGLAENLVDDPIAQEALRASAHFNNDPQATYIILTPPTPIATGEPVYCGYHTQTTGIDGLGNPYRIQYAFIPWLNDMPGGVSCDENAVNATNNAFGNGVFDGYSIVTGHEYAEAITDPDNFFSVQDGWNDASTEEIGDKCESPVANIALGGHTYAVQALWSNQAFDATGNGCVFSR
jgi:serine protease